MSNASPRSAHAPFRGRAVSHQRENAFSNSARAFFTPGSKKVGGIWLEKLKEFKAQKDVLDQREEFIGDLKNLGALYGQTAVEAEVAGAIRFNGLKDGTESTRQARFANKMSSDAMTAFDVKTAILDFHPGPDGTVKAFKHDVFVGDMITASSAAAFEQTLRPEDLSSSNSTGPRNTKPAPVDVKFRWIHVPANNLRWVRRVLYWSLMYYVLDDSPKEQLDNVQQHNPQTGDVANIAEKVTAQLLGYDNWAAYFNSGLEDQPHSEYMLPFSKKIELNLADVPQKAQNCVAISLPYLHWETSVIVSYMKRVSQSIGEERNKLPTYSSASMLYDVDLNPDEKLLRHYLSLYNRYTYDTRSSFKTVRSGLHVRRTLDQYGYPFLEDTAERDLDQVIDRYSRKEATKRATPPKASSPVLMVDQCWIWLLGDNTVVTSFPRQWAKESGDATDIHSSIVEQVCGTYNAAQQSSHHGIQDAKDLMDMIAARCAGNVIDRSGMDLPASRFLDMYERSIGQITEEQSGNLKALRRDIERSVLQDDPSPLFNVRSEYRGLEDIRDIIDELTMISHIIADQHTAVGDISKSFTRGCRALWRIEQSQNTIKVLLRKARETENDITKLLELKQQQTSIAEARWTRNSAIEAGEQSQTLMLFTVVTIIFLPVSSIASLFSLDVAEYGQGSLHLSLVFGILFPVSFVIVIASLFFAFNRRAREILLSGFQGGWKMLLRPFRPSLEPGSDEVDRPQEVLENPPLDKKVGADRSSFDLEKAQAMDGPRNRPLWGAKEFSSGGRRRDRPR